MDFPAIDDFMKKTGLAQEPAFDFLHFVNEPITRKIEDRDVLGLYYPEGEENDGAGYIPPSTIILPPDGTEGTLLHELGHRHGHYYYNTLSEGYAENYRKVQEKRLSKTYPGSYARTEAPAVRVAARSAVAAVADWSVVGFGFYAPPTKIKAGGPIHLVINGRIKDLNAGFFDQWQTAVHVFWTYPDNTLGQEISSSYKGLTNEIDLNDTFDLGAMPDSDIIIHAVLWANHDNGPIWPDAYWYQHGWDVIGMVEATIHLDKTAPPPTSGFGVYIYRGKEQLPSGGLVRPGESIILQADGTPGTALSVEFIVKDSSGAVSIDTSGTVNVFEQKASAPVSAPLTEGNYTLIGKANNWYSNQYQFTVSHLASTPPAATPTWQDQLGSAIKMVAIGGVVIGGIYFVVKSGVLVSAASATKQKLQTKYPA